MTTGIKQVIDALHGHKTGKKLDYKKSDSMAVRRCIDDIGLHQCMSIAAWVCANHPISKRYFVFEAMVRRQSPKK